MPGQSKQQRIYYTVITEFPDYLISNRGNIYRKSTWREVIPFSGKIFLTKKGKRYTRSVQKLVVEHFEKITITKPIAVKEVKVAEVSTKKPVNKWDNLVRKPVSKKHSYLFEPSEHLKEY
jgi:hypothetical protein